MTVRLRILPRLYRDTDVALGPGKADLLAAIAATGSISAAARAMGLSYRRAWLLADTMNRCFADPLIVTAAGGSKGGGARLSAAGEDALATYRAMEAALGEAAAPFVARLARLAGPLP